MEEWDAQTGAFIPSSTFGVGALPGNGDGCAGTDAAFIEMKIPISRIFDPCIPIPGACSYIELTSVLANAGGAPTSNFCQSASIRISLPINVPPVADFIMPDTICQGNSMGTFPTINIDASLSADVDVEDGRDSLIYTWKSTDYGAVFGNPSGVAKVIAELNTNYTPSKTGDADITLN